MLILTAMLALGAADVAIDVEVTKPLKLTRGGELTGVISVRIKNRGTEPVTLQHRDVHGFTFTPVKGGAPAALFHSCDCGFELGLQAPPESRTFTLEPQQQLVLRFDDFACGGGRYRAPVAGAYQLTFQVAPAVRWVRERNPMDFKECERRLLSRSAPAFESAAVEVKVQRAR